MAGCTSTETRQMNMTKTRPNSKKRDVQLQIKNTITRFEDDNQLNIFLRKIVCTDLLHE